VFAKRTDWDLRPNRFSRSLQAHRAAGKKLFDLTVSNPTSCGFDYSGKEILTALSDPLSLKYSPESKGLLSAREAVAKYYATLPGYSGEFTGTNSENVVLTSGTSEAYSYVFRLLCEAGDEILVPVPSYPLFEYLADLNDVRLVPYHLIYDHGWQVDFDSLRAAISPRTRAILTVNPNNPTGSFLRERGAGELVETCAAHKLAIIADEVFLDYLFDTTAARTFAVENRSLCFTLSGLSKISALPQMKLAWLVVSGPEALVKPALDRLEIIADTFLSPGTPVQLAAPRLLALRRDMQWQLRSRIAENLQQLDSLVAGAPQTSRLELAGGWYAVLRVPATLPDEDMAIALLERHSVLIHPGRFFDFPRDGFIVMSLIAASADFDEGARRLINFFNA
jgi:aspartate/methionine/tyrosine aminotransferase